MEKTRYFCDICGEEIKDKFTTGLPKMGCFILAYTSEATMKRDQICSKCITAISKCVKELSPEEDKPVS